MESENGTWLWACSESVGFCYCSPFEDALGRRKFFFFFFSPVGNGDFGT